MTHQLSDINQVSQASGSSSSYTSVRCWAFLRSLGSRSQRGFAASASSCSGGMGLKQLPHFVWAPGDCWRDEADFSVLLNLP